MLMLAVHVTRGKVATAPAIGDSLLAIDRHAELDRHPESCGERRSDPAVLPDGHRGCLRFDSPTLITSRFSWAALRPREGRIPAGRAVHVVVSAAIRDPEAVSA